ncbi:hypothetical protein [Bacillus altitudinis]|uniref:hypothetical protein n=1 Tax=Bacillus altitudinis TaxID=293387 RepID=UPI003CED64B9
MINDYYQYYRNLLKDKYSKDELLGRMQKRFGLPPGNITIGTIGRQVNFDCLLITEEDKLLAIPLKSTKGILVNKNIKLSLGENLFKTHQWVLPPFVPMGKVKKLASTPLSNDALLLFKEIYSTEVIVRQLKGTYSRIQEFKSHESLIVESIECFYSKHVAASITLMLTIIEGISREYCDNNRIKYNKAGATSAFKAIMKNQKNVWLNKILLVDKYILPSDYLEETFLRRIDEGMDLLITYEQYGLEYLYKSNSNHPLNRHSILHGTNKSFYIDINFYRLFSCLEALAFAISLNPFYYSVDMPEEAFKLLVKLNRLENLLNLH